MHLQHHCAGEHFINAALVLLGSALFTGCVASSDSAVETALIPTFPPQATWAPSIPRPTAATSPNPVPQRTPTLVAYPTQTSVFETGEMIELSSIHMASERDGWGTNNSAVWTTRDGGRTWRDVTPPAQYLPGTSYEWYGAFLDANHAWVVRAILRPPPDFGCIDTDASVWYTSNGGQTWEASQPLMHDLVGMSCRVSIKMIDAQAGWLIIDGWYTGAGPHTPSEFFHTTDGGATWNVAQASWSDSTGTYYPHTPQWLSDRAFYDQTGWQLINTSECWPCYGATPAPAYYMTADGGLSWRFHYLPAPSDVPDLFERYFSCEPYQLNLLTEETVRLKLACSQYDENQEPGAIDFLYATEDGGISWDTFELPMASASMEDYYTRMIFFDADQGLLLGREMWRTADGGKTWQHINTVTWDGQFSFVDRSHGWAIARADDVAVLVYTINGGEDWQVLSPMVAP